MRYFLLIVFTLLFSLGGCDNSSNKQASSPYQNNPTKVAKPFPDAKTVKQNDVEVKIVSWKETKEFIKSQKGKIVVLDIWSTFCPPCLREYPHLVALQKKYPQRVVCISFNVNYSGIEEEPPESHSKDVLDFLVKKKSNLINIISSTPDEQFYDATDITSIPVVFVYNTDGTIHKMFQESKEYGDDGFSYQKHITPLVDKLVSKEN
ncbi:hypothetical protein MNBD_PLANCTO02-389 [hydrothermal vent metagenome]|uniref:Thioredoxin domain-containing protein n=1 Tax=hydrothermal vent metagenome TaxID=652676 RepID=A0A3B1D0E2_9ZZZZ